MSTTEDQLREQGERDIENALDRMEAEDRQAADDRRKLAAFPLMLDVLRDYATRPPQHRSAPEWHTPWYGRLTAALAKAEAIR